MSQSPSPSVPEGAERQNAPMVLDWEFAVAAAGRLAPPGPRTERGEVDALVDELRSAAQRAIEPVAQTTGLSTPAASAPALILDRPGWIRANAVSMSAMIDPVLEQVASRRQGRPMSAAGQWVGSRVTGTELAGMLSFLSTKVLGQYDLAPQGTPRLLFVAPNILHAEREMQVDPSDFRLWVALHEETHRVQFTAVPWLREHLIDRARTLGQDLMPEPEEAGQRLQEILSGLPGVLRGQQDITQVLATPAQREQLAQVTAVMSLLEGHADVVMDEVGPSVIPSVAQIRAKFTQRRKGAGGVDKILRRLLGMDAKMRQYRDGAGFVRAVIGQVGMEGFNQIWAEPGNLPLPAEISQPEDWVSRVHR